MFDWPNFLQQNNIYFRNSGPNVGRDSVVIHCCWCGAADESEHLVISLTGKGFKCWRDKSHSGKNPAKLIQALLNCSWEQANQIAGQGKSLPNDFMNKVKQSLIKQEPVQKINTLRLPNVFKPFSSLPSCKPYVDYLTRRKFTAADILSTEHYKIHYCTRGNYKGRVIFTIWHDSKLVGWTGRTIYPDQMARYKSLTHDFEKAGEDGELPAPNPISHYLLFYDIVVNRTADTIVLCEGPMDAWRVNLLGKTIGVVSTCFFTSTLSKEQLNLLHGILPRFKNKYLLLDQNTFSKAARMRSELISLGVVVKQMPAGLNDPGEMTTTLQLKSALGLN